ncbi:MAG TPA: sporulation protein YabP [Bacillota bacterium]
MIIIAHGNTRRFVKIEVDVALCRKGQKIGGWIMEEKNTKRLHQLSLSGRERLSLEGVTNVGSFDREVIILETERGVLTIKGDELHMKQLNLEQGKLSLTGRIDSLVYSEESLAQRNKGFFGKIFK